MRRPDLSYLKNLLLGAAGIVCGTLTGLTVAAGSTVSTPLVRYLLGLRPSRAGATALATTFCGALSAIFTYNRHHGVHWVLGAVLALTQIIGVTWAQRQLGVLRGPAMRTVWTLAAIAMGLAIIAEAHGLVRISRAVPLVWARTGIGAIVWPVAVGLAVGALSQVMDLGGILVVPAGFLLLGLSPLSAQGTALAGLLIVSLPGVLIYARSGNFDAGSASWMSLGALFGGLIGSYYATTVLSPSGLVLIFGIASILIGLWRFLTAGTRHDPSSSDPVTAQPGTADIAPDSRAPGSK
ncbi:MAG: sulfite exporter TauE/SafE family protein [Capsulimonadaceae bacterium]